MKVMSWYCKRKEFSLKEYSNVDWVGGIHDKRCIYGAKFYLGYFLVSPSIYQLLKKIIL